MEPEICREKGAEAGDLERVSAPNFLRRHSNPLRSGKARVLKPARPEEALAIREAFGCSRVIADLLAVRGFEPGDELLSFLRPEKSKLLKLTSEASVQKAGEFVASAVREGQPVAIFADYDVDGITGAAQLAKLFENYGIPAVPCIPDRVSDGYGLNEKMIEIALENGCQRAIAVDLGSTEERVLENAQQKGLKILVIDHHVVSRCPRGIDVILNPHLEIDDFAAKELCASGLTLLTCLAAGRCLGGLSDESYESFIALAALATVCDGMPLSGPNRVITSLGLRSMPALQDTGFAALLKYSLPSLRRGNFDVTPHHLAFEIGPRINAAGRMADPKLAYELLVCGDEKRAASLARHLCRLNQERKEFEERMLRLGVSTKDFIDPGDGVFLVFDRELFPDSQERLGVVGIMGVLAARLAAYYQAPSLVLVEDQGQHLVGSMRTVPEIDALAVLSECGALLDSFGGHRAAAGCKAAKENLRSLEECFRQVCRRHTDGLVTEPLEIDLELPFRDLRELSADEFALLRPFGRENPKPVFLLKEARIRDVMERRFVGSEQGFRELTFVEQAAGIRAVVWDKELYPKFDMEKPQTLLAQAEARYSFGHWELRLEILDVGA